MIETKKHRTKSRCKRKNGSLTPMPIFTRAPSQLQEQINRNEKIPFRAHQISQHPSVPPGLFFFLREPSAFTRAFALSSRFFNPFRRRFWAFKILLCVKLWVRAGSFSAFFFGAVLAFFAGRSCSCELSSAALAARLASGPGRRSGESRTLSFLFWPSGLGVECSGRLVGVSRGLFSRDEAL